MTEENLTQEEEVKTTPQTGSESEDAGDFESLFADEDTQEDANDEDKIARLEKQVSDMRKGMSKFFSDKGRESKKTESKKKGDVKDDTSDIEDMFFEQKPEAELVSDDLRQVAKAKGISILKAWREEKWLQDKASALNKAKQEEEATKSKIDSPSGQIKRGSTDYENMSESEIANLSVPEYEKYREWRLSREKKN